MRIDNPTPDRGMGTGLIAGLGAVAIIAAVVALSYGSHHVADKYAPGPLALTATVI